MCVFLIALIFIAAHKTLEWSIFSEQARELLDTAGSVAEAQAYFDQHPGLTLEEPNYKSTKRQAFFLCLQPGRAAARISRGPRSASSRSSSMLSAIGRHRRMRSPSIREEDHEREQMTRS
jgi:hypothetical protein